MTRSVIDPISRIEGHLRIEMEVTNGKVTDAWASGGLFRGMELVLQGRTPTDASYIAQRVCGVCPVSHCHAATYAAEDMYGITIPNGARLIRNMVECSQFLHSHILWFYNLYALDFVNPINALKADIADTASLAVAAGTSGADFAGVANRLSAFAENGQLSIFTGNWFDATVGGSAAYKLPAELDLIATTHYLEALRYQAEASQISAALGGKMPHIMSSIPGGTTFVPTEDKLGDIYYRAKEVRDWVKGTMLPDTLAIAPYYLDEFTVGHGPGRFAAWGVFDKASMDPAERYLPSGMLDDNLNLTDPDETKFLEYIDHSYYDGTGGLNPREGVTKPLYKDYDVKDRYSWTKAPRYDGKTYEVGGVSRMLVAYKRGVKDVVTYVDALADVLKKAAPAVFGNASEKDLLLALDTTLGRAAVRNYETLYVADLLVSLTEELITALKEGDASTFTEHGTGNGEGVGMWEAPRGALYHFERVKNDKITAYQEIVPTTWNVSPRGADDTPGPIEEALVGLTVDDPEKPIEALRCVHSFDPCVACSVHVSEPATGKQFNTVTSPWGVR